MGNIWGRGNTNANNNQNAYYDILAYNRAPKYTLTRKVLTPRTKKIKVEEKLKEAIESVSFLFNSLIFRVFV